jgi:hypothetical protein
VDARWESSHTTVANWRYVYENKKAQEYKKNIDRTEKEAT